MKLILVSGKKMCKILEKIGFQKIHQVGLGRGMILEILKQIKVSREEYEKLRQEV